MKDIKELALRKAKETWTDIPPEWFDRDRGGVKEKILEYATRLIAAYAEGQEPVAWIAVGGATDLKGGVYRKLFWQQSNARNGWAREWKPLYSAPPEPAPQPAATTTPEEIVGYTVAPVVCAAPSSEEVQWRNIKHVVKTLADWAFGGKDDPRWGTAWVAMVTGLTAKDGPTFNLERLAALVPDGCVVVPREPTEAMCLAGQDHPGCYQVFKAMIAVGEVK